MPSYIRTFTHHPTPMPTTWTAQGNSVCSPGRKTPRYWGTLDRRPRHSNLNVQHANKSPPPHPPPPGVPTCVKAVVTVFDLTGKLLMSKSNVSNSKNTIDGSQLKPGTYQIRISDSNTSIVKSAVVL